MFFLSNVQLFFNSASSHTFSCPVQVSAGWLNTCRTNVFIVLSHHNLGMATYKLQLYCSIFFGTDVFRVSIIVIYSVVLFTVH